MKYLNLPNNNSYLATCYTNNLKTKRNRADNKIGTFSTEV